MAKHIFFLAGLSYGDESKGGITDWLTTFYPVTDIHRYNGGSQAAHHVVLSDGTFHCFSQLGSGLLAKPTRTHLSRFMAVNPFNLIRECEVLKTKINFPLPEIYLDKQSLVITPYHRLINQMREISRGDKRYGSCGKGVGETIKDAKNYGREVLRIGDLNDLATLKYKLRFLQALKRDEAEQILETDPNNQELLVRLQKLRSLEYFEDLISRYLDFSKRPEIKFEDDFVVSDGDEIYEGAQGILLHRDFGFYPHLTQSDTSFKNAEELIKEKEPTAEVIKIGIMRAYTTRHGAGPFVTYDPELSNLIPDEHNVSNDFQEDFKSGWLDFVAARYALKIVGEINGLALTNLDRLQGLREVKTCDAYRYCGPESLDTLQQFFVCRLIGEHFHPIITDIKLTPTDKLTDWTWRQKVTSLLNDCRPIYQTLKFRKAVFLNRYIEHVETHLKTKIFLISTGPTAIDKKVLRPLT